jgi:hypothetical protein
MNNPVLAHMFHTHFSPEGRKMGQMEVILSSGGAPFHYKQRSVWTNRYTRENTFPSIIGLNRFLLKQLCNRYTSPTPLFSQNTHQNLGFRYPHMLWRLFFPLLSPGQPDDLQSARKTDRRLGFSASSLWSCYYKLRFFFLAWFWFCFLFTVGNYNTKKLWQITATNSNWSDILLAYFWTMTTDATGSSETLVPIYQTSRRHIPQQNHLISHTWKVQRHFYMYLHNDGCKDTY